MKVVSAAALAALFAAPAWAQDATYRSALDHYQPYQEAEVAPWKEANETVRQVGGWRAYAREAAQGASASASASTSASGSAPAGAAPPAANASRAAAPGAAAPRLPSPSPAPALSPGAAPHKH